MQLWRFLPTRAAELHALTGPWSVLARLSAIRTVCGQFLMRGCHQNRTWHKTVPHLVIRPTRPEIGFYELVESFKLGSYWIICSYISHKTNKSENEPQSGRISHNANDGLCFFPPKHTDIDSRLNKAQSLEFCWISAFYLGPSSTAGSRCKCRETVFKSVAFLCSFSGGLRKSLSENGVFSHLSVQYIPPFFPYHSPSLNVFPHYPPFFFFMCCCSWCELKGSYGCFTKKPWFWAPLSRKGSQRRRRRFWGFFRKCLLMLLPPCSCFLLLHRPPAVQCCPKMTLS